MPAPTAPPTVGAAMAAKPSNSSYSERSKPKSQPCLLQRHHPRLERPWPRNHQTQATANDQNPNRSHACSNGATHGWSSHGRETIKLKLQRTIKAQIAAMPAPTAPPTVGAAMAAISHQAQTTMNDQSPNRSHACSNGTTHCWSGHGRD